MAQTFTIVASGDAVDPQEALYVNGRFAGTPDGGGAFGSASLLELIAQHTIAVVPAFVEVDADYDADVLAMDGYPESLDEIQEAK